jgi:hypothetical protein
MAPLFREAWFNDAILFLKGVDSLLEDHVLIFYERLMDKLAGDGGITILTGNKPLPIASGKSANIISVRSVCLISPVVRLLEKRSSL